MSNQEPEESRPGRVLVITGGSAGIGLEIARRRATAGDRILITGRHQSALDAALLDLGTGVALAVDAGHPDAADLVVDAALTAYGALDVIVASAAHIPAQGSLIDANDADIDAAWQTNVAAPLRLVRAAWSRAMCQSGGNIVMMGSLGGQAFQPDMGLYCVTKAALHHLTRILAAELGPTVRVNAVAPGMIRTEGARVAWEPAENMVRARSPLGRLGETTDIADAIDFLIEPSSSWITGQVLVIDGGATVQLARPRPRQRTEIQS